MVVDGGGDMSCHARRRRLRLRQHRPPPPERGRSRCPRRDSGRHLQYDQGRFVGFAHFDANAAAAGSASAGGSGSRPTAEHRVAVGGDGRVLSYTGGGFTGSLFGGNSVSNREFFGPGSIGRAPERQLLRSRRILETLVWMVKFSPLKLSILGVLGV